MIQSLSVVVPNKNCINNCPFCVSKMNVDNYKNQMDENLPFYDLYLKDYLKRLEYARDNFVNTIMLTGNSEPQQNRKFLTMFGMLMMIMERPFRNIEMQTTGRLIDKNYLRFLRNHVGVNTISLSVSSFDEDENEKIITSKNNEEIPLLQLCKLIKEYDFNLRISVNLLCTFNDYSASSLFSVLQNQIQADQVTFRVLYANSDNSPQSEFVRKNSCRKTLVEEIDSYIKKNGTFLEILPFGAKKYSVNGISTVLDNDCMSTEAKEDLKYLVLQPNCKLYSK